MAGGSIGATAGALAIGIPSFGVFAGVGLALGFVGGAAVGVGVALATAMAVHYYKKKKRKAKYQQVPGKESSPEQCQRDKSQPVQGEESPQE